MLEVLCFGEALVDFFPDGIGPLAAARAFVPHVGGAPANVAIGLARQGVDVGFLGVVGQDGFGAFLESGLREAGVNVAGLVRTREAQTGICFVTRLEGGERGFTGYGAPAAETAVPADAFPLELVRDTRVLHLGSNLLINPEGHTATWRAIAVAREAGARVACDPNLRAHRWASQTAMRREAIALLAAVDVVKLSLEEVLVLAGGADERALPFREDAVVFVTEGAGGARWSYRGLTGRMGSPNIEAVDTTGAGDAFMAGALAVLCRATQLDAAVLERAAAQGCALGARACTAVGATAAFS